jgi:plastocyanin
MRGPLAAVLVIVLAACSGGASASPVATNQVDLPRSYKFAPEVITVPAGTEVTWTNHDQFTHSVRLLDDGGSVNQIAPGESFSYTFDAVGTHNYDCSFHPNDMKGSVIVTEPE